MDWRATTAVAMLVGLGSGVVCAKEYEAFQTERSIAIPPVAVGGVTTPTNAASFPDVGARHAPRSNDPAFELLASNPYEAKLDGYRTALNLYGENPLLDDPYSDTMRFTNPYENTVGMANPYVDALRESELRRQASLSNPYTARLRADAVNLDNPYTRLR